METTENTAAEAVENTEVQQEKTSKEEKKEAYDPVKVDSIKDLLRLQAQRGNPYYYKIIVDDFVDAVPKTCDIERFDDHLKHLKGASELTVLVYKTASTPRTRLKRIFTIGDNTPVHIAKPIELSGLEALEDKMEKRFELTLVKRDLTETQKKLSDAEEYIDELENKLEKERERNIVLEKERDIKDKKWGMVASGALEGIVRRNPHLLDKLGPAGETLAGIIEQDNADKEKAGQAENTSQGEATFSEAELSEEDQHTLDFFSTMKERFGEEMLNDVMGIVEYLSTHKNEVKTVAELLELKKHA